jgi:predicted Zn-dependent protease
MLSISLPLKQTHHVVEAVIEKLGHAIKFASHVLHPTIVYLGFQLRE